MVIGGLHKNSFIDYPGKISCVLFLSGCNFHCPYCQNPHLVARAGSPPIDLSDVYAFLESRKGFVEGVVISGGEPTTHDDLISLCRRIGEIGYPVKLDTNGSRPELIRELIDNDLVDYIAMDVKTDPCRYDPLIQEGCDPAGILESVRAIRESCVDHEFRTTCVKPFVDREIVAGIAELISGAGLYALQKFNPETVLHPAFFQGGEHAVKEDELLLLKAVAERWVRKCIIR